MSDNPTTVSFRNMSEVIRGLQKVSGQSMKTVIDFEAARVLEKCISMTPVASVGKILNNAEIRLFGRHNTGLDTKRKFKGKLNKDGSKTYFYANKYPDAVWERLEAQRKMSLLKKLDRRGLSKAAWYRMAELANLEVKAPNFIKLARPNISENSDFRRAEQAGSYSVNFRTVQPTITKIGGRGILKRAINGRVKYFQKNMEKGVLNDMAQFARAYKGLVKINAPGGKLE